MSRILFYVGDLRSGSIPNLSITYTYLCKSIGKILKYLFYTTELLHSIGIKLS